jgi:(+)-pinoresinol hydroxylase
MRNILHAMSLMLLPALMPVAAWAAAPGAPPDVAAGKALFDRWCTECHAPGHGHPGTQQLERLRGAKLAVLEQRPDLTSALVRAIVRNGMNAMPAYRQSEISDAQLEQIGQYLAPGRLRR